ncbi:MAG: PDZ domain-containing protein [Desulfuromonadales bacterium]|nr:PDZ domain-containing protein [Desulfuromonadales bacterium]
MLKVVLRRTSLLFAITTCLVLGGCAGSQDLLFGGLATAQLTPEKLGVSAAHYRGYDCPTLNHMVETFGQKMPTESAFDRKASQFHIDAMNQVRAEKSCVAGSPAPAAANPMAPAPGRGMIGVGMGVVTPSLATALGLDSTNGALVVEVISGMPAEKAGIKAMDVVLEITGRAIASPQDLREIISGMRIGYKAELQVWRERSRKTIMVEVASAPVAEVQKATDPLATAAAPTPVTTGPIIYSFCWYTDVPLRKHWTSSVFELVSTPGVDQTLPLGQQFHQFLSARHRLTGDGAFCEIYDTRAQAESQWNSTRKRYPFASVQHNDIAWAPAR